ncbi:hypothetical protein Dsin_019859 [Dipteronia sinensis]|uniref:UDP-N-acetylglucosamine transferase subunit ALG14 n=1 Tax=Dipteronia sinensis TaxID=43782 RepID=A0AAE0E376_9ROSI|nr:hypothetical protein Dsin_019859 [Dipteronia sinensis]
MSFLAIIAIRALYVLYLTGKPRRNKSPQPLSTLVVFGSGGHTAEMMNLLSVFQTDRFTPRFYIAAATDNRSLQKARVFEDSLVDKTLRRLQLMLWMTIKGAAKVFSESASSLDTKKRATMLSSSGKGESGK